MINADTIFALASARGKAGVSVLRVSGPDAFSAVRTLAGELPPLRQAGVRLLRHGGQVLDQALVICFGAGASFTGEDVAELHLHGSSAVVAAVLAALSAQPGLRPAEAGEFTRRALENGCLDLAQVEGLADLIAAETEAQRRQALRVMRGALGNLAGRWRGQLVRALALLELSMDFADEEVPQDVRPEVLALVTTVAAELRQEIAGAHVSERIRDGFEVAIVGRPNVGKSTLLNAIAGREAAIVSDIAGTTRDVLELRLDIGGLPVTLLDTAGLREAGDRIEAIGISRARDRAAQADVRVFLLQDQDDMTGLGVDCLPGDILVQAKADQASATDGASVSGLTGQGIDWLLGRIGALLEARVAGSATAIRARHRLAMERALDALSRGEELVGAGPEVADLAAEELRAALRALESILGRVDVEDLLDVIFRDFCIGK